jgi:hypothetical protein
MSGARRQRERKVKGKKGTEGLKVYIQYVILYKIIINENKLTYVFKIKIILCFFLTYLYIIISILLYIILKSQPFVPRIWNNLLNK